jgi:acetate kinase
MQVLRPTLDEELNRNHGRETKGRITTEDSALPVLVVPTNEELVIAREAARFLHPNFTPSIP